MEPHWAPSCGARCLFRRDAVTWVWAAFVPSCHFSEKFDVIIVTWSLQWSVSCSLVSKHLKTFFFLFDVTLFTVPWSFNLFCSFLQRCFRDMESLQRFRLQCALNFRLFCLWSSNFNLFFNSEIHFQNVPIFSMIVRAYSTWLLHAMSNRKSHKKWKYSQT